MMDLAKIKNSKLMAALSAVIVFGLLFAGLFALFDRVSLKPITIEATVIKQEYQPNKEDNESQAETGSANTDPHDIVGPIKLHLKYNGQDIVANVDKQQYEKLSDNEKVKITCSQRRLTGAIEVLEVQ
ncbi:MAG: hypothetical protein JW841_10730 [Deltaproteobacteria bacterium]|nr:hypothetical protein [Deltaproteobacteria bacterium]